MPRRGLLIAGVAALLVAFAGASVDASGAPGWWGRHMFESDHMAWFFDESAGEPIDGAREVVVAASEYSFTPAQLTVEVGEPVNLTLTNEGRIPHDLVIPELGVHISAGPGRQVTTGIAFGQPGTFEVVCTLPGHAAAGMTGELVVRSS